MSRPTKRQIAAAAEVLAMDWDHDGAKAGGVPNAYHELASGIADIIIHEPPPETLVDYLGVLEEQLCLPSSGQAERQLWAGRLEAAVRAAVDSNRGSAMQHDASIQVLFIAGFGPIVRDTEESRKLYRDVLGIPFKQEAGGYLHTEAVQGAKSFALWPLSQAAQSCFGDDSWPAHLAAPQAWLEFDVDDVEKATVTLESRGYKMLVKKRKEPWGQIVSRFLSPEGLLIGVTFTPSMREQK